MTTVNYKAVTERFFDRRYLEQVATTDLLCQMLCEVEQELEIIDRCYWELAARRNGYKAIESALYKRATQSMGVAA